MNFLTTVYLHVTNRSYCLFFTPFAVVATNVVHYCQQQVQEVEIRCNNYLAKSRKTRYVRKRYKFDYPTAKSSLPSFTQTSLPIFILYVATLEYMRFNNENMAKTTNTKGKQSPKKKPRSTNDYLNELIFLSSNLI